MRTAAYAGPPGAGTAYAGSPGAGTAYDDGSTGAGTEAGGRTGAGSAAVPAPGPGAVNGAPPGTTPEEQPGRHFEDARGPLFGLAYRMLGEATEAESVLREARPHRQPAEPVDATGDRLVRLVAGLCLSRLASVRARREEYAGSWLPEPVPYAETRLGPLETAGQRDTVSLGVLVLLERLSPAERLAFVLREAFGHSDAGTARVLGIGEADARHLHHRARAEVGPPRRRSADTPEEAVRIAGRFLTALTDGDVPGLAELLDDDAMAWFDGGGKVGTVRRPVIGGTKVARHLAGWAEDFGVVRAGTRITPVNGEPALLVHQAGALTCVIAPELVEGRITGVRTIANPDKLAFAAAHDDPATAADGARGAAVPACRR